MIYKTSMDKMRSVLGMKENFHMEREILVLDGILILNDYQKSLLLITKLVAKFIAQKTLLLTNIITVHLFMYYLAKSQSETYKEYIKVAYK